MRDPVTTTTIQDAAIDPDKMMLAGVDTSKKPVFTISEMAKVFFARTSHWVRWLESGDKMVLDGEPVGKRRSGHSAREYTLTDVEEIAHGLAQQGVINGTQLRQTLTMVKVQAEMHGYI